jgi:hypothetical protein
MYGTSPLVSSLDSSASTYSGAITFQPGLSLRLCMPSILPFGYLTGSTTLQQPYSDFRPRQPRNNTFVILRYQARLTTSRPATGSRNVASHSQLYSSREAGWMTAADYQDDIAAVLVEGMQGAGVCISGTDEFLLQLQSSAKKVCQFNIGINYMSLVSG